MSSRVLATNAFWSLLSHVLHRGSMMLAAIMLARTLSPDSFAAYGYFQMTVAMLSTYAALGLGVTASRFFAEVGHAQNSALPPIGTLLALSMAMMVVAFLLILLLPASWLNADLSVPQWLIALGVATTVAGVVPGGGILGLEKYREATLVSALSAIVILVMAGMAVYRQDAVLSMWGIVIGLAIQVVGQLIVIVRTAGWRVIAGTCNWSWPDMHRLAGFAGPMFFVSILAGSGTWIVGRMILAGSGEREFAAYSIGLQWLALGLLLPGIVSRVVLPRLVRSRFGDAKNLVRKSVAMALAPALLLALMGALFAPWLIKLYGSEYAGFVFVIPAFLGIAVLSAPINTVGNAILAEDGQVVWLCFSAISFMVLLVSLVVAPEATTAWACLAHAMATVLTLALASLHGKRKGLV